MVSFYLYRHTTVYLLAEHAVKFLFREPEWPANDSVCMARWLSEPCLVPRVAHERHGMLGCCINPDLHPGLNLLPVILVIPRIGEVKRPSFSCSPLTPEHSLLVEHFFFGAEELHWLSKQKASTPARSASHRRSPELHPPMTICIPLHLLDGSRRKHGPNLDGLNWAVAFVPGTNVTNLMGRQQLYLPSNGYLSGPPKCNRTVGWNPTGLFAVDAPRAVLLLRLVPLPSVAGAPPPSGCLRHCVAAFSPRTGPPAPNPSTSVTR